MPCAPCPKRSALPTARALKAQALSHGASIPQGTSTPPLRRQLHHLSLDSYHIYSWPFPVGRIKEHLDCTLIERGSALPKEGSRHAGEFFRPEEECLRRVEEYLCPEEECLRRVGQCFAPCTSSNILPPLSPRCSFVRLPDKDQ